jgi:hypothetical protein
MEQVENFVTDSKWDKLAREAFILVNIATDEADFIYLQTWNFKFVISINHLKTEIDFETRLLSVLICS